MKSFLKSLKSKIERNGDLDPSVEDRFIDNFRKEFPSEKKTIWSNINVRRAAAACVLLAVTYSYMNTKALKVDETSIVSVDIIEDEEMLANIEMFEELEGLEELEGFEDITDEEWEILVGDAN